MADLAPDKPLFAFAVASVAPGYVLVVEGNRRNLGNLEDYTYVASAAEAGTAGAGARVNAWTPGSRHLENPLEDTPLDLVAPIKWRNRLV